MSANPDDPDRDDPTIEPIMSAQPSTLIPSRRYLSEPFDLASGPGLPDSSRSDGDSSWNRRYQLLGEIGSGGMGTVYLARDIVLHRTVALKFISFGMVSEHALARFFQEAQAVAQLAHPNIVTLFGIHPGDHSKDAPFIEMEYIDGTDLLKLVQKSGPLDVWQAREYIRMAALGLQHAHERGLVHRDIKPSNLILTSSGSVVKILDFGLVRLLRPLGDGDAQSRRSAVDDQAVGTVPFDVPGRVTDLEGVPIGTALYMAPEQVVSPNVDIRADIYSLGCTFYYLLAGLPPFAAEPDDTVQKLLDAHLTKEPAPIETHRPEIPRGLGAVLKRMLAKNPEERYQNPTELIRALDRLLQPAAPPVSGKLQSADELVALLRRFLLLDDGQLDDVELSLLPRFDDVNALLSELRAKGWLTDYQCGQLRAGNGNRLALGGNYILLRPLGEGNFGRVFLARPRLEGREVAVKIIRPELAVEREFAERFRREIRLASQMSHPNVVMVFSAEEGDGVLFLVMEYLVGEDLDAVIRNRAASGEAITAEDACRWMLQAASGLEHIHSKRLVHRDIKPSNLFLTAINGQIKIVDMGLARVVFNAAMTKLTKTRSPMGTFDYMAPEQARKPREVDIRADLYALGCTFYHVLAGRVPFPAENEADAILQHTLEVAVAIENHRPDIPPALSSCIFKLMQKKPEDRYQSPAELIQILRVVDHELQCNRPR
jgi:serine/threonine protein kinase